MANDVLHVLHLDKESLCNKRIIIGEGNDTDITFFHCSLIAKQIKDNGAVCFVNFHNDYEFYNKTCRKLGYNLSNLLETGSLRLVDCMSYINESLQGHPSAVDFIEDHGRCSLSKLYSIIEENVLQLLKNYQSVLIVIDNLNHLFSLGYELSHINLLYEKCKCLTQKYSQCSLEVGIHIISEQNQSNILFNMISHMSHISCKTSALKTGRSLQYTGNFSVVKPLAGDMNFFTNAQNYYYKSYDRGIKFMFAPDNK